MTERYVPVEGWPNHFRDLSTGAVINRNRAQVLAAKESKKKRLEEMREKEQRFKNLESEVSEMKDLLLKIHQRLDDAHR